MILTVHAAFSNTKQSGFEIYSVVLEFNAKIYEKFVKLFLKRNAIALLAMEISDPKI